MENYLDLINDDEKKEILKIEEFNKLTNKYGLMLNEKQIYNVLEKKREVLKSTGRIEFRKGVVEKMIKEFCDSPYINQDDYERILNELIEVFYEYKNQTLDMVADDDLIKFMRRAFDEICKGDIEYLSGTIMYKMKNEILRGKRINEIKVGDDYGEY